jgi:YYY domain-containing protein
LTCNPFPKGVNLLPIRKFLKDPIILCIPRSHPFLMSRITSLAFLTLILLSGFTLRVWNVNFDRGVGSHPDERSTACFYAPTIGWPASWEAFWDPQQSPLNPLWNRERQERRSFTYGHFPLYLGVLAGELLHRLAPAGEAIGLPSPWIELMARANEACDGVAVAGRLMIASLDTLTILLLYALTRRIYGQGVGLVVAAFYAYTAQAIQLSHFFAMDPASTTFTVLAVLGALMMVQERTWRAASVAGVGAGLAIASKFSALPILLAPLAAGVLVVWDDLQRSQHTGLAVDGRAQLRALLGMPLALVVAALVFFITSPYAVLDRQSFIQATLVEQGAMVRGVADMPFTRQYRNTTPYLYFIEQQVRWGLGWPLGVVAAAGTLYAVGVLLVALYRLLYGWAVQQIGWTRRLWLSREALALLIVWSWVLPYFGITGAFLAKFNRYMSPILPFVLLFTGGLLWRLWSGKRHAMTEGEQHRPTGQATARRIILRAVGGLLAAIGIGGGLFWSAAYVNGVYNHEHTWLTASRWIYQNAPRGSTILWELWDDALPKTVPNEPGMDMGSAGLRNIDWSPYEEDTAEKFAALKERLRAADFVAYSSKRIYDSVDELPERYPLTTRYYAAMWSGELGFELALDATSPPRLWGFVFQDRTADESWSLYDHPQVTIFRKVRELSDGEFDALFARSWERAIPYYRGPDSPLSPFLELLGLGSRPDSQEIGLINRLVALVQGEDATEAPVVEDGPSLLLESPLAALPVVDNYRWNRAASESVPLAVFWWWLVLALLGWAAWPLAFYIFRPLRDRGYLLSRTLGWLLAGWLLWWLASAELAVHSVVNSWLALVVLALGGMAAAIWQWGEMRAFLSRQWPLLLVGEVVFAVAFLLFVLIRMGNPDLWQPWFGGEKFMEFAFLNGILRSPFFPPVDPHFAGGYINYYYFGIYLVAYLIKLTGIYAEVAFNLAIPTLFALTVVNSFGVVYSAIRPSVEQAAPPAPSWRVGAGSALLGPLFVTLIGNLDGFAQIVRNLARASNSEVQSAFGLVQMLANAGVGLLQVWRQQQAMPAYDFWGPSRVIPDTINEFPYWSFLFADLHAHVIGIPLAVLFLGLTLSLLHEYATEWRSFWRRGLILLAIFALMLGTLASVNLWELPTYFGIGVLALLVIQVRGQGRIHWLLTGAIAIFYLAGAYLCYLPFFRHYAGIGASGVGLVKTGDALGQWLLIWGLLAFVLISWLCYAAARRLQGEPAAGPQGKPVGGERWLSLALRQFDRLPRFLYLQGLLVQRPSLAYLSAPALLLLFAVATALAWWFERPVLAFCLLPLAFALILLWRRSRAADAGVLLTTLLAATGLAILAGTQVLFLKDFLSGGDAYRMNTLFKFFSQVWVLWGVAAAVALPAFWSGYVAKPGKKQGVGRMLWGAGFALLLVASFAYPIYGTPARLDMRMVGWRPPFGTLNALDYMREGSYTWPDDQHRFELKYDWEALQWLLKVRGNTVIVESDLVGYYREGGSRVASITGLSGLRGMHESEQRYGEQLGPRDGLHREFWATPDVARTLQIIDELQVALIYVGQLERQQHPDGVQKLAQMAADDLLEVLFHNDGVDIYLVPGRLSLSSEGGGYYYPTPPNP